MKECRKALVCIYNMCTLFVWKAFSEYYTNALSWVIATKMAFSDIFFSSPWALCPSSTHSKLTTSPPLHSYLSLYFLGFIISPPCLLNLHSSSLLAHLSGILNLSPFWHPESLNWVKRSRGTAPAWIFQQAVILNMTLSSVLSLWSSILPCQTFFVRGLNDAYSHCLWGER